MTDAHIQLKATEGIVHLHKAIKNVQLYPPGSPTVENSIERLYLHFRDILQQDAPLVFAESEKKALLRGKILNQKEQETNHITTLLDILFGLGIKSISFDKGLSKEELYTFINFLAKKPETIFDEGGLPHLMAKNRIAHIYIDNKIYVAMDKDHKNISQVDASGNRTDESAKETDKDVSHLPEELFNKNPDIRQRASSELAGVIESLSYEQQINTINKLSGKLIEWVKQETTVTPAYRKICNGLQKLLQNLINQERFAETIPIMQVFSDISTGTLKKDAKAREVSLEVLRNLASENNINILLKEFDSSEQDKEAAADKILAGFDDIILNKLLDIVKDVSDSRERVRIIHLIEEMGQNAIPGIKERISNINAPWYYLRNLAYILGHIGNEASAYILQPLLLHKNERVRMEALKSIAQTGGNQRGPMLLSILPQADDQLKINIIEMLGKAKYTKAVPNLLDILKNKSSQSTSLQEKICNALGAIGSRDAIPALSEIAESKSFLGIRPYPVEVKYAAKRALASISRKQEETAKT